MFQLKWSADEQIQDLGRSNRSNQVVAPEYVLASIDAGGDKRFSATIARRLAQLGALTRGQSGSVGANDIEKYNFESDEGTAAANSVLAQLLSGRVQGIRNGQEIAERMGLVKPDDTDVRRIAVKDLFNRINALNLKDMNAIYRAFEERFQQNVERAAALGLGDWTLRQVRGDSVTEDESRVIATDKETGAETVYTKLKVREPRTFLSYANAEARTISRRYVLFTPRDGRGSPLVVDVDRVQGGEDRSTDGHMVTGPGGESRFMSVADLNRRFISVRPGPQVQTAWDAHMATLQPYRESTRHIISGAVIPNWNRLRTREGERIDFAQAKTTDVGKRIVGVDIRSAQINRVLQQFDAGGTTHSSGSIYSRVMDDGQTVQLLGGLRLTRSRVHGERRLELAGVPHAQARTVELLGAFVDRINYEARYFLPASEVNLEALEKILQQFPVIDPNTPPTTPTGGGGNPGGSAEPPTPPVSGRPTEPPMPPGPRGR